MTHRTMIDNIAALAIVAITTVSFSSSVKAISAGAARRALVEFPRAEYLFGLSASTFGRNLLVYRSTHKPDGEITVGKPFLVKLSATPELFPAAASNAVEDLAIPVWDADGREVYFITQSGIYSFDLAHRRSALVVSGLFSGLALSSDGKMLAYWDTGLDRGSYARSIFSLVTKRTIRMWKVPVRFEADQYGHEIAFSSDGSAVFARTYDEDSRTPLKQFELGTGKIRTVWDNCSGVANGSNKTYFIGDDRGTHALFELSFPEFIPRKILAPFQFDSLSSSGSHRWIVSINSNPPKIGVFDSKTRRLTPLNSTCENAAVLRSGKIVCSSGGDLLLVSNQ